MWTKKLKQPLPHHPKYIIGSDEVGTGALAGPIVVTAVVYPFEWNGMQGLQDSKKYKTKKDKERRKQIAEQIYQTALTFSQYYIPVEELERRGFGNALLWAFRQVLAPCVAEYPDSIVIVDGCMSIPKIKHLSIPKADSLVPAVSAASVLGKVERDWWMNRVAAQEFPLYGFENHVGYGTPEHYKALDEHGVTSIHRKNYKPIRRINNERTI